MTKIKIGGAALNQTPLDWKNNLENISDAISTARSEGVSILCLPELCITGYGCEDLFLSKWLPETALNHLKEIIEWCAEITVCVGLPIWYESVLYNCACLIHNKEIQGFIPKQQLANDGVHYEPRWFTGWEPGRLEEFSFLDKTYPFGDRIYQLHDIRIGFEICEDAWTMEKRPAHSLYKKGVQLVLNPSASHFAFHKSLFRENLVVDSSANFECIYVYSNLLGNEAGRMIFDGDIFIAQNGRLLQRSRKLSLKQVILSTTMVDLEQHELSEVAVNPEPKDDYREFTDAVTLALFDYLRKSKSHGFVLSLSGGADSSSCAVLVAEMVRRGIEELGVEAFLTRIGSSGLIQEIENKKITEVCKLVVGNLLTCVYQATRNSSQDTFTSAKNLADSLGATFHHWNIDEQVGSYRDQVEKALDRSLNWEQNDTALQNIQARTRAPGIWMLANIKNALLISTSNRSEGDVGYATMDGDTCGSIAPIAAVDKFFILGWLKWAEETLGYSALSEVNQLQPSAELRPLDRHQTDEDDLMPYHVIVAIERLAIRDRLSPLEVFNNLKHEGLVSESALAVFISKFYKLWSRNQWKRERIAPSFHLDEFNIDPKTWCRFPILSGGFEDELKALENHLGK